MKNPQGPLDNEKKLAQENFLLKAKLMTKDGFYGQINELDPEIENKFLKNVLAFENAEQKRVFEILGVEPKDFPPGARLSEKEIKTKFNQLVDIMAAHNFVYELSKDLPLPLAYEYLRGDFLHDMETVMMGGWSTHVDGCTGDCPSCFQQDYCQTKSEIWTANELEAEKKQRREEKL